MLEYLDNPVFICGHRKTGTTALLCMFDNHPELVTHPADTGFFYHVFPRCETAPLSETIERLAQRSIRECLRNEMNNVDRLDLFDVEIIAARYKELAENSDGTPPAHLCAMIQAYAENCGQDPSHWKGWVEKTTSTEIYATQVAGWFPNAKFIHLLRDPRDNWASLKSGWNARYKNQVGDAQGLLQSLIDRGGLGMRMASFNTKILGRERYMVVRYEDLTREPANHLRKMVDFIGVSYDESLETPTVNGVPWPGNNFDGLKFKDLSSHNVGRWKERSEPAEIALIEAHLGDLMESYGYVVESDISERAHAATEHYKWFNFLEQGTRGDA